MVASSSCTYPCSQSKSWENTPRRVRRGWRWGERAKCTWSHLRFVIWSLLISLVTQSRADNHHTTMLLLHLIHLFHKLFSNFLASCKTPITRGEKESTTREKQYQSQTRVPIPCFSPSHPISESNTHTHTHRHRHRHEHKRRAEEKRKKRRKEKWVWECVPEQERFWFSMGK